MRLNLVLYGRQHIVEVAALIRHFRLGAALPSRGIVAVLGSGGGGVTARPFYRFYDIAHLAGDNIMVGWRMVALENRAITAECCLSLAPLWRGKLS